MATCKGDVPITTKVDESTRELVDKLAEKREISRAEVLRQLIELYHQSVDGDLECPSCTQTVRIRPINGELAMDSPDELSPTNGSNRTEYASDTTDEPANTEDSTFLSNCQEEIDELKSTIENQQQELDLMRQKITAQEREIAEVSEQRVSSERIDYLEGQTEWVNEEIRRIVPRIEALTEVSDLPEQGTCPTCGSGLTVKMPFTGLGGPAAVKCSECESIVGHQR